MGSDELKEAAGNNYLKNVWAQSQKYSQKEGVYFQSEKMFTPCLLENILLFQWHNLVGKQPLAFCADLQSLQENLSKQLQSPFSRW